MLSVRRDRLPIHEKIPCLTVRIGYRKFIYVMADRDADELMASFASEGRQFLKGIGFSKRGIDTGGIYAGHPGCRTTGLSIFHFSRNFHMGRVMANE